MTESRIVPPEELDPRKGLRAEHYVESKVVPVYWDLPDREHLQYTSLEEAIEGNLDGWMDQRKGTPELLEALPETLTLAGFARMEPDAERWPESVLEDFLNCLDENYGNPDDYTDPTEGMKEAAKVFVEAVLKEYTAWACIEVCRKVIDVHAWVRYHRPEWLGEL